MNWSELERNKKDYVIFQVDKNGLYIISNKIDKVLNFTSRAFVVPAESCSRPYEGSWIPPLTRLSLCKVTMLVDWCRV